MPGSEIQALAERLQAPVLTAQTGKGAFPESHPLSLGCKHRQDEGLYELLRTRDVALVVGCRLGARVTDDGKMPLPGTLIQIDRSAAELGRARSIAVSIQADAAAAVSELLEALPDDPPPEAPDIMARMGDRRRNPQDAVDDPRAAAIFEELRRVLPDDGVLVNDMTMTSYRSAGLFPVDQPRSYMFPIYFGTLGFSLPAAIGAQVACPERPVLSLSGDGGFLFTAEELATACANNCRWWRWCSTTGRTRLSTATSGGTLGVARWTCACITPISWPSASRSGPRQKGLMHRRHWGRRCRAGWRGAVPA